MADCHPTPPLEAEFAMVCLVPSLPATLFAHPFPRHVRQCLTPIKSSLTSISLGLPFPSLPATLFAHPFPRHVCQCLAPIKSLLTSRSLGLLLPICSRHLICSPSPHRVLLHGWLDGGSIHGWFGCSLNVSRQ